MESAHAQPHFVPTSLRTAIAIRNACMSESVNEHDIEDLVAAEPATGAAILRFSNSALFRRGRPITGIWQGMMLLGNSTVRHIASHVAMMQLVHGLKSGVIRQAAEELHHHSIVVSAIAEAIAAKLGRADAEETCAALGLFHELPAFIWLASVDREGTGIRGPEALARAAQEASPLPMERAMLELGLPTFAAPDRYTLDVLASAHRLSWVTNPLLPELVSSTPDEGGLRLDAVQLEAVKVRVRMLLALIGEHSHLGTAVGEDIFSPVDAEERAGPISRVKSGHDVASNPDASKSGLIALLAITAVVVGVVLAWLSL